MTEKHYPYCGGSFDRIIFDKDGSMWVPETENTKLRELVRFIMHQCNDGNPRCEECIGWNGGECVSLSRIRELGIEVGE